MRGFRIVWTASLLVMAVAVLWLTFSGKDLRVVPEGSQSLSLGIMLCVAVGAFICEYVDSSLGMGYGTTLTPLLMIFGFAPLQIVPAVLVSEFLSGVSAGLLHHRSGNVRFVRDGRDTRVMGLLAACSIVGTAFAVFVALNLPKTVLSFWIGCLVLVMGIVVLWGPGFTRRFSWKRIAGIGLVAAFNKGMSGGGYGPLVTGGQILSGTDPKGAVGITSLAEGLVCLVGAILYVTFQDGGIYWPLAIPLAAGAILSVPLATWTVKVLPPTNVRRAIGFSTIFLGILSLAKAFAA